jgi:hypothetical protein
LPVWLSEWNLVPREDLNGDTVKADLDALLSILGAQAEAAFWFCWSDGMVAGLGLVDEHGERKPVYQELTASMSAAA